jgi:hypothetical protein
MKTGSGAARCATRETPRSSFSVREGWKNVPPSASTRMARARVWMVTSLRR